MVLLRGMVQWWDKQTLRLRRTWRPESTSAYVGSGATHITQGLVLKSEFQVEKLPSLGEGDLLLKVGSET
jgi:hypothetical protein